MVPAGVLYGKSGFRLRYAQRKVISIISVEGGGMGDGRVDILCLLLFDMRLRKNLFTVGAAVSKGNCTLRWILWKLFPIEKHNYSIRNNLKKKRKWKMKI